jgi:hypothetical protein
MHKYHTKSKAKRPSKYTFQPLHGGLEMIHSSSSNKKVVGRKLNKTKATSQVDIKVQQGRKQTIIGALRAYEAPK